jgi:hypothetical protein
MDPEESTTTRCWGRHEAEEPEAYRFSAHETRDILAAKREARKAGKVSGPFTTAESLTSHLRQAKP